MICQWFTTCEKVAVLYKGVEFWTEIAVTQEVILIQEHYKVHSVTRIYFRNKGLKDKVAGDALERD